MDTPYLIKALLQEKLNGKVRCLTCERRCEVMDGGLGWCRTRQNEGGTLYTLIYGNVSSLSANPIEKKPLYHFYPGSVALTAGSWSCNFNCPWCQNWDISKSPPRPGRVTTQAVIASGAKQSPSRKEEIASSQKPVLSEAEGTLLAMTRAEQLPGRYVSPEDFVAETVHHGCQGTSISFNEPTLSLEWSLDVFRLARQRGLYNTYVTNGYMTSEALELLVEAGLDAMNVDIKGDAAAVKKHCGTDVEKVWRNCREGKKAGVHIEVTTLVIPTVNDDEGVLRGIARRIRQELGVDTTWHCSGYYPAYKFSAPPTPLQTLERAHDIGREEGLDFVYLGNVLGHPYENTYCPGCGELLIRRWGLSVAQNRFEDNKCPGCGRAVPVVTGS